MVSEMSTWTFCLVLTGFILFPMSPNLVLANMCCIRMKFPLCPLSSEQNEVHIVQVGLGGGHFLGVHVDKG